MLFFVLAAEFINGWTDAPNAVATVISTRVLSPYSAIVIASVLNTAGAFAGTAVATTIGKGIVNIDSINVFTILAALISIVIWGILSAHYSIPISKSHALIAGLAGAALAEAGPHVLLWAGWKKVLMGLVFSGLFGFVGSLVLAKVVTRGFAGSSPVKAGRIFSYMQIASSGLMAFEHGSNDGQKFIGIFTLTLVLGGVLPEFRIMWWVILICALTMGMGTMVGGKKLIKEIGMKMVDLKPWQGFCAETSAGLTISLASHLGIPMSTTHVVTTSIMGVGASRGMGNVRWDIVQRIVTAWMLTFPICGTISFIIALILKHIRMGG
ncbi:Phosphate transporter [Candidatus Magnetobacterium bavaricum]|uniref:Phosphate transporter n=1 Tax=Candidatus Magnetobacterium bavaricum TaxID=29290 RepID=A0A0F3GZK4_9BACT|nr:Phosphate transporter [Candidatus Magnetobacterium bavaricum]